MGADAVTLMVVGEKILKNIGLFSLESKKINEKLMLDKSNRADIIKVIPWTK